MVLAHKSRALLAVCLMVAASSALIASKPVFWQTAIETEFLRGEVDNLSIDGHGRIYKDDRTGKGTAFFDPDDKYIWSLALDSAGNVYAGTGEKGVIYKITPDGKGTPFYQTKATHVITLQFQPDGQLLAGTESPGRLFRIDRSGKAFLLLDSTFQEIHAIRIDPQGNTYVAALSGRPSTGSGSGSSTA